MKPNLDLTIVKAKPLQTNRIVTIKLEDLRSILGATGAEKIGFLRNPCTAGVEVDTLEGRKYRPLVDDEIQFILTEGFD